MNQKECCIMKNHYEWLDENFSKFLENLGHEEQWETCPGIITAHGDKCYGYRRNWENAGIPFAHGVAIYLLSYLRPWDIETMETEHGWVDVCKWVVNNYERFKPYLPPAFKD